jgi:hypothetical protein
LRGHLKGEGSEEAGSQSYVPADEKYDKALVMALKPLRRTQTNPAFPPNPKAAHLTERVVAGLKLARPRLQRDCNLRDVGGSGRVDRDRLTVGVHRYSQIRCKSDALDRGSNLAVGDRPGDVADRIAGDFIPFAGEVSSRCRDLAFDFKLVAVARAMQSLIE